MITDTGTIHGGEGAASGTWWPVGDVGIREWLKHALVGVDGGGTGALRAGVPGLALYRPQVEALATIAQRERMREILAVVDVPRVVYLWDRVDAVWRRCHLGSVGFAVAGPLLSRVTFEVLS
jgi:hypothetical protein